MVKRLLWGSVDCAILFVEDGGKYFMVYFSLVTRKAISAFADDISSSACVVLRCYWNLACVLT